MKDGTKDSQELHCQAAGKFFSTPSNHYHFDNSWFNAPCKYTSARDSHAAVVGGVLVEDAEDGGGVQWRLHFKERLRACVLHCLHCMHFALFALHLQERLRACVFGAHRVVLSINRAFTLIGA